MTLTTTFGIDVWSGEDVDPARTASEAELVAQDLFWRLQTPRGMGILADDAPDYGIDLADMIGSAATAADAASLPGRIRAEATKDERISECVATVVATVEGPATSWVITIVATLDDGVSGFTLVVGVSDVTVSLLRLSAGGSS